MSKEGVASLQAARAARAKTISTVKAGGTATESELRGYGITPLNLSYGEETVSGYKYYDPATKQYVLTSPEVEIAAKAEAEKQQKDIAALEATTTQKEKDVMTLQYAMQTLKYSPGALEKARAAQQEIMKDLPEKEPVETALRIGGKIFVGTYGLKRIYSDAVKERIPAEPALYRGKPSAAKTEDKFFIPIREPSLKESRVPSGSQFISTGIGYKFLSDIQKDVKEKIIGQEFLAPTVVVGLGSSIPSKVTGYKLGVRPIDVGKITTIDLNMDMSKVAEYRNANVGWGNIKDINKALSESNFLLQKNLLSGQTLSVRQKTDLMIGEAVSEKVTKFYSGEQFKIAKIAGGMFVGVGVGGQVLGSLSKVGTVGKLIKIGSPILKGVWVGSLTYRGAKQAEYIYEGQTERGIYGLLGIGAEIGGVYAAGKWLTATEGKPITKLYEQTVGKAYTKFRQPFFERDVAKWESGLYDKNLVYMDRGQSVKYKTMFTPEEYADYLIEEGKLKGVYYYVSDKNLNRWPFEKNVAGYLFRYEPSIAIRVDADLIYSGYTPSSTLRHELIHYKYPDWSESDVLRMQGTITEFPNPVTYEQFKSTYSLTIGTPQRTLYGTEITQGNIDWLREDVNQGFYNIDMVRTELVSTGLKKTAGFSNVDFNPTQEHITSDYNLKYKLSVFKQGKKIVVKRIPYVSEIIPQTDITRAVNVNAVDWFQGRTITITPENMITSGYSQMLDVEPTRFTFINKYPITPTLGERELMYNVPNWPDTTTQSILISKPSEPVTKFKYLSDPTKWDIPTLFYEPTTKEYKEIINVGKSKATTKLKESFASFKTDRTALDRLAKQGSDLFSADASVRTKTVQIPEIIETPKIKLDFMPTATTTAGLRTFLDIRPITKTEQKTEQITQLVQETKQKTETKQVAETKLTYKLNQILDIMPITKTLQETKTTGGTKLALITTQELEQEQKTKLDFFPIVDIILKPEPTLTPSPFNLGFRFPSLGKEKFGFSIPKGSRLKKREVTVEPFAGLYDVHVSEFMFGKATHPARTRKEKEKFKRRIRESSQLFPTVELERAFRNKIKL
jgi:hypothetical protein